MSREKIDESMHDKKRTESLKKRGVDEERAKRVGTVPLDKKAKSGEKKDKDKKGGLKKKVPKVSEPRNPGKGFPSLTKSKVEKRV